MLIVCCYSATAQNSGIVQDSENQPIKNVSVFIADQSILLKTNKLGEFFFDGKLPDNTYLNFYKNGYVSKLVKYKEGIEFVVFLKKLPIGKILGSFSVVCRPVPILGLSFNIVANL